MRIDASKLGLATAIVFAIVWIVCSLFVVIVPGAMMSISGHMLHGDLGGLNWTMHWTGFFVGLAAWTILLGVIVWAMAAVYNRLLQ